MSNRCRSRRKNPTKRAIMEAHGHRIVMAAREACLQRLGLAGLGGWPSHKAKYIWRDRMVSQEDLEKALLEDAERRLRPVEIPF